MIADVQIKSGGWRVGQPNLNHVNSGCKSRVQRRTFGRKREEVHRDGRNWIIIVISRLHMTLSVTTNWSKSI
jgi:hypothetical protein